MINETSACSPLPPDPLGLDRLARALRRRQFERSTLTAQLCASVVSLDELRAGSLWDFADPTTDVEAVVIAQQEARYVRALVEVLPAPYGDIVRWRFGLDGPEMTLAEVALALAVSRSSAARLEQQALAWLRQAQGLYPHARDLRLAKRSL